METSIFLESPRRASDVPADLNSPVQIQTRYPDIFLFTEKTIQEFEKKRQKLLLIFRNHVMAIESFLAFRIYDGETFDEKMKRLKTHMRNEFNELRRIFRSTGVPQHANC